MAVPAQVDFWKATTGALLAALIAGSATFLRFGNDDGGWSLDKAAIERRLSSTETSVLATASNVDKLETVVAKLADGQDELQRGQAAIQSSFELTAYKHEVLVDQVQILVEKMDRVLSRDRPEPPDDG